MEWFSEVTYSVLRFRLWSLHSGKPLSNYHFLQTNSSNILMDSYRLIVSHVSFDSRAISRIQENGTDTRVFSSEFLPIGLPSMPQSSELNVLSNNGSLLPIQMKPNRERPNAAPMLTFTYIIFFLQNLCNPLIYIVSNRAYRTAYYKILWRKSHSPPDGTTLYRSSQHRDAFEMNTQYA